MHPPVPLCSKRTRKYISFPPHPTTCLLPTTSCHHNKQTADTMTTLSQTRNNKNSIRKDPEENFSGHPSCRNISETHLLFPHPGHIRRLLLRKGRRCEIHAAHLSAADTEAGGVVASGYAIDIALALFILFFSSASSCESRTRTPVSPRAFSASHASCKLANTCRCVLQPVSAERWANFTSCCCCCCCGRSVTRGPVFSR